MKILLSAYSCIPNRGSEPGIGWGFFENLAKEHEVVLLTTRESQDQIEAAVAELDYPENVDIIFFDLPGASRFLNMGIIFAHLYYTFWQIGIYFKVKKLLRFLSFDLIHHVTYGAYRTPSLLAFLGIPFIFGPVGGGESYPVSFRKRLPWRYQFSDIIREIANRLSFYNPLLNRMYEKSELIICRTPETKAMIPEAYHSKCMLELGMGIDQSLHYSEKIQKKALKRRQKKDPRFKLLFVGRPAYWKGLNFIIEAYAELLRRDYAMSLTFIGLGNNSWPEAIAKNLHIHDQIEWIEHISLEELIDVYAQHDLLIFPSLRELGGNAILEAFAHSLPVLCLDMGHGTKLVEKDTGILVKVQDKTFEEVIDAMAEKIIEVYHDKDILRACATKAKIKSEEYRYTHIVNRVYDRIEQVALA